MGRNITRTVTLTSLNTNHCRKVFRAVGCCCHSLRRPCTRSCGCSSCGDSWLPKGTKKLPSSVEGRRWGRGRGTSPASPPPHLEGVNTGGAGQPRPGSSRRCPEYTDLMRRGEMIGMLWNYFSLISLSWVVVVDVKDCHVSLAAS